MNYDIDRWIDRVQNLMDVQKAQGCDLLVTRFSRADMISLMILLKSLKEIEEKYNGNND